MPVLLVSYPRSGNTMFRIVANLAFGIPSFSLEPATDYAFSDELASLMGCDNVRAISVDAVSGFKDGDLLKTHLLLSGLEKLSSLRRIYVVRDGRDCLVSFAHHGLSPAAFQERLGQLTSGNVPQEERQQIGTWSEHVLDHLDSGAVVCRYEDMIADPVFEVGKALRAAGLCCAMCDTCLPTFEDLQQEAPMFFRRGKISSWRDEMPPELEDQFWANHGRAMREMGYDR